MATLQIEFNCLCMFVRDREGGVVHVLMPSTRELAHAEHHVVRLIHPGLNLEPQGRSMIGWALSLGPAGGTADVTLRPGAGNGAVADLSAATGSTVDRALVEAPDERIASRVTLRAGRIARADAERRWMLDGREVSMAHRVLWEMENVSDTEPLDWHSLGAAGAPPLGALRELAPEPGRIAGERLYRLRIFHTTPSALPPNDRAGTLNPPAFARHFARYYPLLGLSSPASRLLPAVSDEPVAVAAGGRSASLAALGALGLAGWHGGRGVGAPGSALDRRGFIVRGGLALGAVALFGRSATASPAGPGANGETSVVEVNCASAGGDLRPVRPRPTGA